MKVGPGVTLIRQNKVVKLARPEGRTTAVTVEVEQDAVGRELFFAGDEILAVAADTEEHAKDALRAIKIEYEVLDHIVNEEEVLKNPKKKTTPGPLQGNLDGRQGGDQGRRRRGLQGRPTRPSRAPTACRSSPTSASNRTAWSPSGTRTAG